MDLDEVNKADRKSCLDAIGRYGSDSQKQFAIASRLQEYADIEKDAPVYLQVEIAPIDIDQVKEELRRIGFQQPEAPHLLKAIETDALLEKAIKTPFYFNILQLLFAQGKRLSDLNFGSSTIHERQEEIIEKFIASQLTSNEDTWATKNSRHWLRFLASSMNQKKSGRF